MVYRASECDKRYQTGIVDQGGRERVCIVDTRAHVTPPYICAVDEHKTIADAWARAIRFGARGKAPSHYTLTQRIFLA